MLQFCFLGTSSGVPTRERNVSGLAVWRSGAPGWFLVDAGEGTQHRLQQQGLSLHALSAICITHVHGDHCYGLPGLLASAGMAGRKEALTIIAPAPLRQWLQATQLHTDLHLPYALEFVDVAEQDQVWSVPGLAISRHALKHRVPSFAYRFEASETQRLLKVEELKATGLPPGPLWKALQQGQDVEFGGQLLRSADYAHVQAHRVAAVIGGDNAEPGLLHAACQGAQLLVHEATYTQQVLDKVGPGPMHSSALAVASFAQQAALPNLILTHLSARYHNAPGEAAILEEARSHFHGQLWLARDGNRYALERDGTLQQVLPAADPA
jgi:ribonuclease Z